MRRHFAFATRSSARQPTSAVPKETRAELHERYAAWLEEAAGEPSGELEETIGYHLEQACRHYAELGLSDERTHQLARRASVRLASAGQAAIYRDTPVASSLLERAAALLPAGDTARLEILPELAEALFVTGNLARGKVVGEEAIEVAGRQSDRRIEAHAFVVLLNWQLTTDQEGKAGRAERVARDALRVFEEAGDELGLARAWSLLNMTAWARGQMTEVQRTAERGLVHARSAQHERLQARLLDFANSGSVWGPVHIDEVTARGQERSPGLARGAIATLRPLRSASRWASAMRCAAESTRVADRSPPRKRCSTSSA